MLTKILFLFLLANTALAGPLTWALPTWLPSLNVSGNVGIGTTSPAVLLDVGNASPTIGAVAASSGVTDLVTLTGTYTGNTTRVLKIQITATAPTGDTFEWNVNGSTQNTGFIASTTAVALNYIGISVTFATTTGHTIGNYWTSTLTPSNGNINASNAYYLNEGLFASAFGSGNTSVGLGSMSANPTGSYNTANGYQALLSNTTGSYNTANGYQALLSNTTGGNNTANGLNVLNSNTTGGNNTANGASALYSNTTGGSNTANGSYALYSNTTGSYNTALGYEAGRYISGGSIANATSSNSLYLGYNTMALASGDTNEIVIGNGTVGLGSNTTVIGSSTATTLTALYGNVGIGTTSPNATLEVNGPSLFDSGVTIASIEYLNSAKTPISGTAGAITWTEPYQGNSDKRVYVQLNGYTNASPTTIVFTQAFTSTPALTANTTGLGTPTATASQIIISAATLVTGWFIYQGF